MRVQHHAYLRFDGTFQHLKYPTPRRENPSKKRPSKRRNPESSTENHRLGFPAHGSNDEGRGNGRFFETKGPGLKSKAALLWSHRGSLETSILKAMPLKEAGCNRRQWYVFMCFCDPSGQQ